MSESPPLQSEHGVVCQGYPAALRGLAERFADRLGLAVSNRSDPGNGDMWFRLPGMVVQWKLDVGVTRDRVPSLNQIGRDLEQRQRHLFAMVREHLTKHDRSPTDRLEQVETAARKLLDQLQALTVLPGALVGAWSDLDQLLREKPGAVSWAPDAIDPKVVVGG